MYQTASRNVHILAEQSTKERLARHSQTAKDPAIQRQSKGPCDAMHVNVYKAFKNFPL